MLTELNTHETDITSQETPFSAARRLEGSTRTSSVFNFLLMLLVEENRNKPDFLKNLNISRYKKKEPNDTRDAFFIQLADDAQHTIPFPDHRLTERHLTIDARYSTKTEDAIKSRFSMAHYTEIYEDSKTKDTITAHIYYDSQGQFITSQAKYQSVLTKTIETLTLNASQKREILTNSLLAAELLGLLLQEKATAHKMAISEMQNVETQIERAILVLDKPTVKKLFVKYKESIKKVNHLSDLAWDTKEQLSIKHFLDILGKLETAYPQASEKSESPMEVSSPENQTFSAAPINIRTGLQKKIKKKEKPKQSVATLTDTEKALTTLLNELNALINQTQGQANRFTPQLAKERARIEQTFRTVLVHFMISETQPGSTTIINQKISIIQSNIKSLPDLLPLLKQYFKNAEAENFKALFLILKNQKDMEKSFFTIDFLQILFINTENLKKAPNYKKILDFLFESSNIYRGFVVGLHAVSFPTHGIDGRMRFLTSVLGGALLKNNFLLFQTLLKHGANLANFPAILCKNRSYTFLDLIIGYNKDPMFLTEALQYGAIIDQTVTPASLQQGRFTAIQSTQQYEVLKNTIPSEIAFQIDAQLNRKEKPHLVFAVEKQAFPLLPLLATEHVDLETLLLTTGRLVDSFQLRILNTSNYPGVFFSKTPKIHFLTSILLNPQKLNWFSLIFHTSNELDINSINIFLTLVRKKISNLPQETVMSLLRALLKSGFTNKDIKQRMISYMAGLCLLSYQRLTPEHRENLVIFLSAITNALLKDNDQNNARGYAFRMLQIIYLNQDARFPIDKYTEQMNKASRLIEGTQLAAEISKLKKLKNEDTVTIPHPSSPLLLARRGSAEILIKNINITHKTTENQVSRRRSNSI